MDKMDNNSGLKIGEELSVCAVGYDCGVSTLGELELIQIDHDTYELVDRQKTPRLTGSQERELINQELTELYGTNQPWR